MTIREALKYGAHILKNHEIDTPVLDTGVILANILMLDRVSMYKDLYVVLKPDQELLFVEAIKKRCLHMPVSYITGCREFMSLKMKVSEQVLIPRPETEILVEWVLSYIKNNNDKSQLNILDLGTGSGCIAISIAFYSKNITVYAVDNSSGAISVAKDNIRGFGLENRIRLIKGDMFESLPDIKFDMVVSNPPYITSDGLETLSDDVRNYEPLTALDGGKDGLLFYRLIAERGPTIMKTGSLLALEMGAGQHEAILSIFKNRFEDIRIINDLQGIPRVFTASCIQCS